jgi:hypothetical protein
VNDAFKIQKVCCRFVRNSGSLSVKRKRDFDKCYSIQTARSVGKCHFIAGNEPNTSVLGQNFRGMDRLGNVSLHPIRCCLELRLPQSPEWRSGVRVPPSLPRRHAQQRAIAWPQHRRLVEVPDCEMWEKQGPESNIVAPANPASRTSTFDPPPSNRTGIDCSWQTANTLGSLLEPCSAPPRSELDPRFEAK